jgi:predicted alpha/beta-hydrolase family hydrolase
VNLMLRQGRNLDTELPDCGRQAVDLRSTQTFADVDLPLSHSIGDSMLSALVETVGALGILASVVVKVAEWRKQYRIYQQRRRHETRRPEKNPS